MKSLGYLFLLCLLFLLVRCSPASHTTVVVSNTPPPRPAPPPPPPATYQVFYDELGPYGRWIDYPGYGYVWVPAVGPDFRPYASNGHWVYSNYGWTWVSNYNWGWATFHYGRWFYEDGYGWMWLPGHEWAPAWVAWGHSGGYYGWAPLAPHVSINISIGSGGWTPPPHYWTFVPAEHIAKPNVTNYIVNNSSNTTIVKNVTIINNVTNNNTTIINKNITNNTVNNNVTNNHIVNNTTVYNRGPQVNEVEKLSNTRIQQVNISENAKPGESLSNNQLAVYRPAIKEAATQQTGSSKPIPQKVEAYHQQPARTVQAAPLTEQRPAEAAANAGAAKPVQATVPTQNNRRMQMNTAAAPENKQQAPAETVQSAQEKSGLAAQNTDSKQQKRKQKKQDKKKNPPAPVAEKATSDNTAQPPVKKEE